MGVLLKVGLVCDVGMLLDDGLVCNIRVERDKRISDEVGRE